MSDDKKIIFLSHSSKDSEFANVLSKQLKAALANGFDVFNSSWSGSIPSGEDWMKTAFDNLEKAVAFIVLITPSSINSPWVAFEVGYFWKKRAGANIHVLYHPDAQVPSPLNSKQAKNIISTEDMNNFWVTLLKNLSAPLIELPNIEQLIQTAQLINTGSTTGLDTFFEYIKDTDKWVAVSWESVYTYRPDLDYQIELVEISKDIFYVPDYLSQISNGEEWFTYHIKLTYRGKAVYQFTYYDSDDTKYMIPEVYYDAQTKSLYWKESSISIDILKIITETTDSRDDVVKYLHKIADRGGIEIR